MRLLAAFFNLSSYFEKKHVFYAVFVIFIFFDIILHKFSCGKLNFGNEIALKLDSLHNLVA